MGPVGPTGALRGLGEERREGCALRAADRADLQEDLARANAEGRRHTPWAALGASLAALPLLLAMGQVGVVGVLAVAVGVTVVELARALAARRRAAEIEARLEEA